MHISRNHITFLHPKRSENFYSSLANKNREKPQELKFKKAKLALSDIFSNEYLIGLTKQTDSRAFNKLALDSRERSRYKVLFDSEGFTPAEAESILDQAIYHAKRAASWSNENETKGDVAARTSLWSMGIGIVRSLLSGVLPSWGEKTLGLAESGLLGLRGNVQYSVYCGRHDDDGAQNTYEAEYYGNSASGLFAKAAGFFEKKVNIFALPFLSLLSSSSDEDSLLSKVNNAIAPILSLPNLMWWRIRMGSEICQGFSSAVLDKLFGGNGSPERDEILSRDFISSRLMENIGIDPEESSMGDFKKAFSGHCKKLVSSKTSREDRIVSSIRLNKVIAPFLGLYGFFATGLFTPLRAIGKLWGENRLVARGFDALTQTGVASQQAIYSLRMMIPELLDAKNMIHSRINGFNALKKRVVSLNTFGLVGAGMNIVSPFLKLLPQSTEGEGLGRIGSNLMKAFDIASERVIPYYFSRRREIMGHEFKLHNPELFFEGEKLEQFNREYLMVDESKDAPVASTSSATGELSHQELTPESVFERELVKAY